MKKKMMLFAAVAMSVSMLAGTSVTALAQDTARVGSLKGPTSMGLVSFMNEAETEDDEDVQFTFEMMAAADEVSAGFTSGDLDIALVPANIASILYNKTEGKVQVIDVNTLGVLYIVTADESIAGVADLKGKTIYSTGKGQTPEYVLNYLLEANGISQDDVTVEFKSEATEVVSVLAQDESAIGILPQPFATAACKQNENLKEVCDLTQEWDKTGKGTLVTGVTIAKKDYIDANPEVIEEFLDEHEDSIEFAEEDTAKTAELVAAAGIVEKAPIAEAAIPKCNLKYLDGEEMKTALGGYLEVLMEQNPESIGGSLPGDDFYYTETED
ncbi:ABC transporter substrate-binding protein [Blautia sp. HCP3S3_G3]|uniref:ABC transporter substrate-binding protein n=1 Tax=Blautia sp. HCP3S3_G3 TaxID=3438913 RepID=UPI003F8B9F4B